MWPTNHNLASVCLHSTSPNTSTSPGNATQMSYTTKATFLLAFFFFFTLRNLCNATMLIKLTKKINVTLSFTLKAREWRMNGARIEAFGQTQHCSWKRRWWKTLELQELKFKLVTFWQFFRASVRPLRKLLVTTRPHHFFRYTLSASCCCCSVR